jgi:hypothetical protein
MTGPSVAQQSAETEDRLMPTTGLPTPREAMRTSNLGDPFVAPPPERPFVEALREGGRRLKIAFTRRNFAGELLHADCIAAVESVAALCADLGMRWSRMRRASNPQ